MKPEDVVFELPERLAAERKRLEWSLDKLSEKTTISKTHLWELEQGRALNPSIGILLRLCKVFGVGLNELLGLDPGPQLTVGERRVLDVIREHF